MAKYRVKDKVPHLKVDGKVLGPGETFEQTAEYYERNKAFVNPVFPPQKLVDPEPTKVDEEPTDDAKPTGGRVVRQQKNK
jgi:hypothetical protein